MGIFEAKGANAGSGEVDTIDLTKIQKLIVKRYSFKELEVTGRFYMGEVNMASVVSMAFDFKFVKEFSVFASKFDRISMFGIKLARCKEFNVLGMTHFASLAAHAIKVKCDKFSLAYNWFGHLHDSSFDVEYGLCDIQGNTFVNLGGKPFLNMRPRFSLGQDGTNEIAMMGLVFRENKFASEPVLPFASLAMPSFSLLSPSSSYIDIDKNQFHCSCQKLGWFLAFGKFGYNSHSLAEVANSKGSGSNTFIRQLYESAGLCISCDHRECIDSEESLDTYTETALEYDEREGLSCGMNGLLVRNYDDTSDKQIVAVDNSVNFSNIDSDDMKTNSEQHSGKANDHRRNKEKIDSEDAKKDINDASDEMYNVILEHNEEILTQPQHQKKTLVETNAEGAAKKRNEKLDYKYEASDQGYEEKERLLSLPSDKSDASNLDKHKYVFLVTVLMLFVW